MEVLTDIVKNIQENISAVILLFAAVGITIDLTPAIKIQPVRYILKWIGKQVNHDINDQVTELKSELDKFKKTVDAHIIDSWRQEILAFSNSCINHVKHTKEEYDHIIEVHSDYIKKTGENNIRNGKVELAYKIIEDDYMRKVNDNSFFLGKGV